MHRSFVLGFTVVALLGTVVVIVSPVAAQEQPQTDKPEVIALKFHADWCATCRRMGPIFEDLATVTEEEPVLFTELDLTDRSTRKQAEYLLSLLNLEPVWKQAGAGEKTGFILLVDVDSRQPLARLTADQNLKQMKAAVLKAVTQTETGAAP